MVDTVNEGPDGTNERDVNLDIAKDVQVYTRKEAGVTVKKLKLFVNMKKNQQMMRKIQQEMKGKYQMVKMNQWRRLL